MSVGPTTTESAPSIPSNRISTNSKLVLLTRVLLVLIGLAPVAHICFLIATTCANVLAHDYQNIIPPVDALAQPNYDIRNLVKDTSMGPHCLISSVVFHYLAAKLTDWNTNYELFFGAALALIRVVILVDCIGPGWQKTSKWMLLSAFMCLHFGTSMCSQMLFGNPSMSAGVGMLGFAAGLWGLTRAKNTALAVALAFVGGTISASFGQFWTVATWTVFFLVYFMTGLKRFPIAIAMVGGALLSIVELLSMERRPSDFSPRFNLIGAINVLGRSFCNDIATNCLPMHQSEVAGCVGLALLVLLIASHLWLRTSLSKLALPAGMVTFGVLGAVIISMSRNFIAPWYAFYAVYYWAGLLAAAVVLFQESRNRSNVSAKQRTAVSLLVTLSFVCVSVFYLQTNLKYTDKDWFRRTHAPCSASTARHFMDAPTYAEPTLFAGQLGDIRVMHYMCEPLWRHGWSVFAPHQQWALQGDFVLPDVTVNEVKDSIPFRWISGRKVWQKKVWSDPEHLNMCLDPRNSVTWRVELPPNASSAVLKTAVSYGTEKGKKQSSNPGEDFLRIVVETSDGFKPVNLTYQLFEEEAAIALPLHDFAGKSIGITFSGVSKTNDRPIVVAFPRIDLFASKLVHTKEEGARLVTRPSNTELSSKFPSYTENDLVFEATSANVFKADGLHAIGPAVDGVITYELDGDKVPSLNLEPAVSVNSQEYSSIVVEQSASSDILPRALCLQFVVNGTDLRQVIIPLLFDEKVHKYSYDLKLMELEPTDKIVYAKLLPAYLQQHGKIGFRSIRFVRRSAK